MSDECDDADKSSQRSSPLEQVTEHALKLLHWHDAEFSITGRDINRFSTGSKTTCIYNQISAGDARHKIIAICSLNARARSAYSWMLFISPSFAVSQGVLHGQNECTTPLCLAALKKRKGKQRRNYRVFFFFLANQKMTIGLRL
jgi:hypothetical protein